MFRFYFLTFFILITAFSFAAPSQEDRLTPQEVKQKIESSGTKLVIIDVRDDASYKKKHIEGAISIPYKKGMAKYLQGLDAAKTYIIYDKDESKSGMVWDMLKSHFKFEKVYVLSDGLDNKSSGILFNTTATGSQPGLKTVTAKFIDGGRLFENEFYITFKPQKGPDITFNVLFPDEKITRFNLFTEKNGMHLPNSKMKNKTFSIKYSEKQMEDENTGDPVKRNFIESIEIKK